MRNALKAYPFRPPVAVRVFPPITAAAIHSRSLTVDHTQVPSTQSNFTVLVSFTNATLKTIANGGHVQRADGFDIIFTSDSGGLTKLKWEMESYDGTNGIVIAWVKIASLSSSSDTVFYMFYGDTSITTDQSDKANTWDANFIEIWHMDDNAASTTILASIGSNATNVANTSTKTATGQVGNALTYNGTTDAASVAIDLSANNILTLSFWLKWTTFANDDKLAFEYTPNYNNAHGFLIDPNAAAAAFVMGTSDTGPSFWTDNFTRPSAGAWHLYHLVMNRNTPVNKAYVDGSSQALTTNTHTSTPGSSFANSTFYFMSRNLASLFGAGTLDEVHLSAAERSADWVTCEWNNQKAASTFVALGTET